MMVDKKYESSHLTRAPYNSLTFELHRTRKHWWDKQTLRWKVIMTFKCENITTLMCMWLILDRDKNSKLNRLIVISENNEFV